MKKLRKFSVILLCLMSLGLLSYGATGCTVYSEEDPYEEEYGEWEDEDSYALLMLLLSGPSNSVSCSTDINNPQELRDTNPSQSFVASGQTCYYLYTARAAGMDQTFTLTATEGAAELYLGTANDTTGGTPNSYLCTETTAGGGWEYCVRGLSPVKSLSFGAAEAVQMNASEVRVIAVYGTGINDSSSEFTISVQE